MSAPKVRIDAVGKIFGTGADEFLAIDRIDLDVAANEFVSIVGPPAAASPRCSTWWAG
jgi:NitT/TauT family transport system ATP-binding protein/sulfonate transport system ATP-binding protein